MAEGDGENMDEQEIHVDAVDLDQDQDSNQDGEDLGGDEAGANLGQPADLASDSSSEAEPDATQVLPENMTIKDRQTRAVEALLEERAAYSRDRADFNHERLKMAELMFQAEQKLSADQPKGGHSSTKTGMASSKSPRYNGETEWTAFLVQFETWMQLHGYNQKRYEDSWSGLLGLAMEGEAQVFFSGLSVEERHDFQALKTRLEERYSGEGTAEVFKAKLQSVARRQPGDSLSKLRDVLWLWTRKGYPRLPREALEQIALDAMLRAVDSDLRVPCSMRDCRTLFEAVATMERYEAVIQADPDKPKKLVKMVAEVAEPAAAAAADGSQLMGLADLCAEMASMMRRQLDLLTGMKKDQARLRPPGGRRQPRDIQEIECFRCHQRGHYANTCSLEGATAQTGGVAGADPLVGR